MEFYLHNYRASSRKNSKRMQTHCLTYDQMFIIHFLLSDKGILQTVFMTTAVSDLKMFISYLTIGTLPIYQIPFDSGTCTLFMRPVITTNLLRKHNP